MDKIASFMLKIALILTVVLSLTYVLTMSRYHHGSLSVDCDRPVDYPVCSIARSPQLHQEYPLPVVLLGSAVIGAIIVSLSLLSYLATIRHSQREVVGNPPAMHNDDGPQKVKEVFP